MAIQNKEMPNNFSLPDWAPPAKRIGDAAGISHSIIHVLQGIDQPV
jgi:hypothetical protein